jgi:hypothetical protein
MVLPASAGEYKSEYMQMLNEDLIKVREAAKEVQNLQQQKRIATPQNSYQVGDYVLFDEASKGFRDQKLKPRYSGPYLILFIHKADITCRHIVTTKERVFHMENLKPYFGSLAEAYDAGKCDDDQHVILNIIDYRGDPETRSEMEFYIQFEKDDAIWLRYNSDLASSTPFQNYILMHRELEPLTVTSAQWRIAKSQYNKQGIMGVEPGDSCFVLLKSWGVEWFQSLFLPVGPRYVVQCNYIKWTTPKKKKIDVRCPLFNNELFEWNAVSVRLYGMSFALDDDMILVDAMFCQMYPKILA